MHYVLHIECVTQMQSLNIKSYLKCLRPGIVTQA